MTGSGPDEATARDAPSRQRYVSIGGGRKLPYPEPGSAAATKIGKANKRTGTKPEVRVRSALHRAGLRFRKDHLIRAGDLKVRPDIVFTKAKVAVFIDGCFWHGCPEHGTSPKTNTGYWGPKLQANLERDRRVNAALGADGWRVVRLWEHEELRATVQRVRLVIAAADRWPSAGHRSNLN